MTGVDNLSMIEVVKSSVDEHKKCAQHRSEYNGVVLLSVRALHHEC
jgi:hypothetical protein